ncbi:endolytic transglycosylase MltG [Curtobacterium albidum]|uniref:endolytic transglycosylase MltG n=1 Tax=Curtobacterium citreum TaxID=2036 RepID=UPI002026BF1D|nr:endolytic transglycosylase MltG [Curtobacterium albidum]MCL9664960.1 endolytic transglycosylase MltG [Curtobacterium albidum]
MADDLDWDAIIAPGDDAGRRRRTAEPAAEPDRPMSRREARAAEAAGSECARRVPAPAEGTDDAPAAAGADARGPASQPAAERPASPADAPVARSDDELHPDVRALLTGELRAPDAQAVRDARAGNRPGRSARAASDSDGPDAAAGAAAAGGAAGGDRGAGGTGDGRGRSGGGGGASRPPREPRPKRRRGPLIAGIVIVALVLVGGVGAYAFAAPKVQQLISAVGGSSEPDDYTGDGTSKVTVTIKQGDIGEDVAKTLQRSGVVKSSKVFYKLLLTSPDVSFQPGSYELKKQMSSKAALAALKDSGNRVQASIVIPEGTALQDIEAGMVSKAGLSEAEVSAAAKDVQAYGLPAGATTLEGWLFPATYPINPGWTAKQYFQSMVDTMKEHLAAAGVAEADQERVVVFASLVQKEAGLAADYPKVARVFQNRLDIDMPLQSDATVAYGTGNTHKVTTTDAERADAGNPYNTYVHKGLPPAPISNPGDVAIKAVTNMADGKWLYFVTVDLDTGETVFSDTYAEHQVAVKQFQAWLRAHPEYQ